MIDTQWAKASSKGLKRWHLVLFVDDEPETLLALRRALEREPYDVVTTDRPAIALEWLRLTDVSLIITDQKMPEMEGVELLDEVARKSPTTTRAMLTGYPECVRQDQVRALIPKPWDGSALKRTIHDLLRDRERRIPDLGRDEPL